MVELTQRDRKALRRKVRLATLDALQAHGGQATRADIRAHVLQHGDFTDRERRSPPPAGWTSKHATLLEGLLSFAPGDLKKAGLVTHPAFNTWALAGAPEPLAVPTPASRLQQLRTMQYADYLLTPEWREVRGAALARYGLACALDATHTERLEVHHRDYGRRGEERLQDVIVLCHDCHLIHHDHWGRPGPRVERPPSVAPPVVADVAVERPPAPPRSRLRRLLRASSS